MPIKKTLFISSQQNKFTLDMYLKYRLKCIPEYRKIKQEYDVLGKKYKQPHHESQCCFVRKGALTVSVTQMNNIKAAI